MYKYLIATALFFMLLLVGCSHGHHTHTSAFDYIEPHKGPVASEIIATKTQNNQSGRIHIPPVPEPTTGEKAIQNGMLGLSIIRVIATPFTLPIP